jgi:hypothetical protein
MKEQIDIERLLEWAYREHCIDRQVSLLKPVGPSKSVSGNLGQYVELGTRVDNSGAALKAQGLRLPEDAMIVHDAVLSTGEMWIEWKRDDEVVIWDRASAVGASQQIEKVAGQWLRRPITPNGRVASFGVVVEQAATVALLIIHAKNAARPEWFEGWSAREGRPARDTLPTDRRGRVRKRSEIASIESVMHGRAVYAVWRAALALLAIELDGALQRWTVTGPAAPESPWDKAPARILEGLRCQNSTEDKPLNLRGKK